MGGLSPWCGTRLVGGKQHLRAGLPVGQVGERREASGERIGRRGAAEAARERQAAS